MDESETLQSKSESGSLPLKDRNYLISLFAEFMDLLAHQANTFALSGWIGEADCLRKWSQELRRSRRTIAGFDRTCETERNSSIRGNTAEGAARSRG